MDQQDRDELELTLRGFSPEELKACAERRCACFGYQVRVAEIRPCMVSPGGHVRLYEGHFVAARQSA
jgi:hypothetical protein